MSAAEETKSAPILVEATEPGYYNLRRRKAGDRFYIRSMSDKGKWMQVVDQPARPEAREATLPEDVRPGPVTEYDLPPDPKGNTLSEMATSKPQSAEQFFGKAPRAKSKDGL